MSKKRVIVLGAGLAGLSAAWHLKKRGIEPQVFEKEKEVGGLCSSRRINGFIFDQCGHLLHFKHNYTFNLVKQLLGPNLVEHQRSAWVYYLGKYSRYPFQANFHNLEPMVAKECLMGFINAQHKGRFKKREELNFLEWINRTFGPGIARHFMVPYNTKFWTVHPRKLTCDWFDGFIPVPSLSQVIEGAVSQGHHQYGYNARFWYPKQNGIAILSNALKEQIKNVETNCPVCQIDQEKKEIKLASGQKEKYDYLISTLPLPEVPKIIKGMPKNTLTLFKKLRWNSIFNLNLGLAATEHSGRHWVYFPEKEFSFFRVGFFHNFYQPPKKMSSLYAEVSYSRDKPLDKHKIVRRIKDDLKRAGIIPSGGKIIAQEINDIEYGYPIYDANYKQTRELILKYLSLNNIISCGRYGSWRYFSMEDAMLDGKQAADIL
ncbi:MAG: FAD-dependent oxidoreductase [Candidatus Omnitrophica bacterium]|nr:FAD-dependent oxidoreductase [Candidatus Omnitrophota bacterium]